MLLSFKNIAPFQFQSIPFNSIHTQIKKEDFLKSNDNLNRKWKIKQKNTIFYIGSFNKMAIQKIWPCITTCSNNK